MSAGKELNDSFGVLRKVDFAGGSASYYSLPELENNLGVDLKKLPYSIRILLESVLRNVDGFAFTEEHVRTLATWQAQASERTETPYKPARVILQDFTGVPAVVDLAAMRDSMKELGGDPARINPQIPCDLVIDHSVQVDYFGSKEALKLNEQREFERNSERYEFLKWGQGAFENFRVVPPSTGIVHQVNLEYLSSCVFWNKENGLVYPDTCVGTDSHTPMVNGLGVVAWGVGGIEAEAVMLDQPIYMLIPDVIGFKLTGRLPEGTTATDLVLRITEICRQKGVVGKFVEFFGDGVSSMTVADRATISNMTPEHGSTVSFFPVDEQTLDYLRLTGRPAEIIDLVERYTKEQGLFRSSDSTVPEYTDMLELDLSSVEPAIAGPKRPQDRITLKNVGPTYRDTLLAPVGPRGLGLSESDLNRSAEIPELGGVRLEHGSVVIAAITSCTNTSNPSVMIAAGLVAKKAVEKGLKVKPYVKTSLAPGSTVVTEYLTKSGLLPYLAELGFDVVGYGCTTCIGNSGPLPEPVAKAITENDLVVSAVLSGNRNFEGRVNPLTRTNYLASPPLVVAYALFGTTAHDITTEPIGQDSSGNNIYLKDLWPTSEEIQKVISTALDNRMFEERYKDVWKGSDAWREIDAKPSVLYEWKPDSTYVRQPPFFSGIKLERESIKPILNARVIGVFGDSVTTDHISPAGAIAPGSPAAKYLEENGVERKDWNSYGSRRGNHEVMVRGTFANIRIKNRLVPGKEGNVTVHLPSGEEMTFFEASQRYAAEGTPLIVLAGKEYGSGSSRDWAAKGPYLQNIKAVIAESYERIHRSNLIGMGILPLEFMPGESVDSLGLTGKEIFSFNLPDDMTPQQILEVGLETESGEKRQFKVKSRIDTPVEIEYYRNGGILRTVLKSLAKNG
ncbi:MAG: aconitate hydratase AcnA [Candidatus Dadabacteria bacterium]|nr:MAG: aconitate hydratase AcnA [Candidatus Dadabacteria bacterium]